MSNEFEVLRSDKVGLDSKESYIVIRNGVSFLRILGEDPCWTVMTATASEDNGSIRVCSEKLRLIESALRLCASYGVSPCIDTDHLGREYVKIGTISREPGETEDNFQKENNELVQRFFEIFDGHRQLASRSGSEMRELYDSLAADSIDGEIYLSDGVWLSSDGSVHERDR